MEIARFWLSPGGKNLPPSGASNFGQNPEFITPMKTPKAH